MLLQAKKEFQICSDIGPEDVFFYYTTTFVLLPFYASGTLIQHDHRGWMMWNFLISGLTTGCTLVLYDGSPLKDVALLWRLVDQLGITIFGTSAKYLDHLSVQTSGIYALAVLPLTAQIEEVQASETPRSWHASSHLLDGIALGTAAVRLRVSRNSSEHLVGIYHW